MSLGNPIALVFAAAIPLIVVLYLLKLRRKKRVISSTFFWTQMVQDLQANVPFQKLRWNILMFLQILIAAAIVGAMTDLGVHGSMNEGQRTIFVIDTSASMGANEGGQTRLQKAVSETRQYCSRLANREEVMIIEAGEHAQALLDFTSDLPAIQRALNSLTPHDTRTDIATAYALAQGKAAEVDRPLIVIVSDMSGISQDLFSKPKYPLKFLQVGEPDKNVAITDFTVAGMTQTAQGTGVNAFLVVKNFLPKPVTINVEFDVDGQLADVRSIEVDGGARTSKLFKDVPYGPAQGAPGVLEAKLQYEDDLALDNVAYAIPSAEQIMTVLQVGDDPFLTLALGGLPGIRLFKIKQDQYQPGGNFDLTFLKFTNVRIEESPNEVGDISIGTINVGGKYNAVLPTYGEGAAVTMQFDANGKLLVDESYALDTSLVDTTNIAANTYYYPSSSGMAMVGYKDFSLTGKMIDAAATSTLTVEGTNDEVLAGADWIQVWGYDTKNNTLVNSVAVVSGTTTFAWDFDNLNYKYVRVKLVTGDGTNTIIVKARQK